MHVYEKMLDIQREDKYYGELYYATRNLKVIVKFSVASNWLMTSTELRK